MVMKKIMLSTDFSERSDRALRRATLLARQYGASIALVHVVDDDRPRRIVETERDEAEALLHQLAATLRDVDGVNCDTRVVLASPFAGIVRAVTDAAPDLLVIGPHRRQMLRDVLIGTTAERVIRSAACPVLMVNAMPVGDYQQIMQTTDLSDGSRGALQRFDALEISGSSRAILLHVFNAPALQLAFNDSMSMEDKDRYLLDEKNVASRRLADYIATAGLGRVEPMVCYDTSSVSHEIRRVADAEKVDLIVLSTRGRSGLAKILIGSVAEEVLRISPIDVLAVPPVQ